MTPEKMKPEELVRYLAVEGMGFQVIPSPTGHATLYRRGKGKMFLWNPLAPRGANDIWGEDMLVEKMRKKFNFTILISEGVHSPYDVMILNRSVSVAHAADTLCDAICLACAKALMAMKDGE